MTSLDGAGDAVLRRALGDSTHEPMDETVVLTAIQKAGRWLIARQAADGHWCGELEGDSILQSEYILLLAWLGRRQSEIARRCARYLLRTQLPTGGWSMYPGGRVEISGSVKAYFALKLTGEDPDSEPMQRARTAILAHGGADAVNSFTRFYLALLGQISYEQCPAVPPEFVLVPRWSPVNMYRISAWSRTIFVPLSIMWAQRPKCDLPPELGIRELFVKPPEQWPELRCPGREASTARFSWEKFFRWVDRGLKALERRGIRPLRRRALAAAERWMLDRFQDSDGLGAIFPPIVWSIVALKCLGYDDDSEAVQECHRQLDALVLHDEPHADARLQPCLSPVWDTAIALRALTAAGASRDSLAVRRAVDWLLGKEVRCRGDWSERVSAPPGGWFFEYRNAFYPDVDDTIMVAMALRPQLDDAEIGQSLFAARLTDGEALPELQHADRVHAACQRALRWTLAMQNRDGGWGAFDKDNDLEFLCHVPFADHNAMIDPSTPDITARVLEMLGQFGCDASHPAVRKALAYVRSQQEPDGAWYGRWGVNYIYGTWQVLVGLRAIRVDRNDSAIVEGVKWFLEHQNADGGWGESADSYEDPRLRGRGKSTASQTAWALLGLLAAERREADSAIERGVEYLVRTQQADGRWVEEEFTGTGFPCVFYLRYHLYPQYFPLLALGAYAQRGSP
ncbi:MAG: squalene--hopene cyclase [Pirellulales bacterium]